MNESTRSVALMEFFNCCVERNPPIEEVVQSGVVPRLVEFLSRDDYPELQVCFTHGYSRVY